MPDWRVQQNPWDVPRGDRPYDRDLRAEHDVSPRFHSQAGRGPRGYVRADARIHDDVCDRLYVHDELDASDIDVYVDDGRVTLEATSTGHAADASRTISPTRCRASRKSTITCACELRSRASARRGRALGARRVSAANGCKPSAASTRACAARDRPATPPARSGLPMPPRNTRTIRRPGGPQGLPSAPGKPGRKLLQSLVLPRRRPRAVEHILTLIPGSYVTHAKLMDLGSGEVMSSEEGKIRIRFASGERSFLYDRVVQHLTITTVAVAAPAAKPKKAASKRKA